MKNKNPFLITKESAPHLYLSDTSGIYLNQFGPTLDRGISVPINKNQNADYYLSGIQIWCRFGEDQFSSTIPILEIETGTVSVSLSAVSETNGERAAIYSTYSGLTFYQNGLKTTYPVLYPEQWEAYNIIFNTPVPMSGIAGEIVLRQRFLFNNIAIFTSSVNSLEPINGSYIYDDQIGKSTISIDDESNIRIYSNGMDILTDVEWKTFDKNPV